MKQTKTTAKTLTDAYNLACDGRWHGQKDEEAACSMGERVLLHFGASKLIAKIGAAEVTAYRGHLRAKGLGPGTINRYLSNLQAMLTDAHHAGWIVGVPPFRREREPAGRDRFLTREEEAELFDRLADDHRRLCLFLVETGCRLSEALRLEWRDVQSGTDASSTIRETKNGKTRVVPLTQRALNALYDYNGTHARPFCNIKHHEFRADWSQAREAVSFGPKDTIVPHILRHTCASRLVQLGVPIQVVGKWLGHTSIATTMRYAHLAGSEVFAAAKLLDRS